MKQKFTITFLLVSILFSSRINAMEKESFKVEEFLAQDSARELQFFELPDMSCMTCNANLEKQIPELFGISDTAQDYCKTLEKLHIAANLLLVPHMFVKKMQELVVPYDDYSMETSDASFIHGFYFSEAHAKKIKEKFEAKGSSVNIIDSEIARKDNRSVELLSKKGKAALLQLFPLTTSKALVKTFNKHREVLDTCIQDSHEEVSLIARHVKNILCQQSRTINLMHLASMLFLPLQYIEQVPNIYSWIDLQEQMKTITNDYASYAYKDYSNILEEWLEKQDMQPLVRMVAPHSLWTYKFMQGLTCYVRFLAKDRKEHLLKQENEIFNKNIKIGIEKLVSMNMHFENMYKRLLQEQQSIFKKLSKKEKIKIIQRYSSVMLLSYLEYGQVPKLPPSFGTKKILHQDHEYYVPKVSSRAKSSKSKQKKNKINSLLIIL
jgi:hypothetical protein